MIFDRLISILAGFLVIAAISSIARAEPAPPRVVLMGIGDERVNQIREVTEITLAQGGHVRLLDRHEIDRVLTEQGLSTSGLIDAGQAVKVGRLLSADLLAVIDSAPGAGEAGLVIFDARTGVRFVDRAIVIIDGAKAAGLISDAVLSAAAERNAGHKPTTICLATVRNADLPHDMDGLCDAMGRLLERSLLASGSIAVLERSRLDQVTQERALAADAAADALLGSVVMIDLEFSREGGDLRAVALLTDTRGKNPRKFTANVKGHDSAALVRQLCDELARAFDAPAIQAFDAAAESSRFCREAMFRCAHNDWAHAVAPAEAAHALAPADIQIESVLVESLIGWGNDAFNQSHFGSSKILKPLPIGVMPALVRGSRLLPDVAMLARQKLAERRYAWLNAWAVSDRWVWAGNGKQPWGRTDLATGATEYFDSPRRDSTPFSPRSIQILEDGNRVLVGDEDGIWLLTMDAPPTFAPAFAH